MKSYFLLFIALASCASAQETSTKPPLSEGIKQSIKIVLPMTPVLVEPDTPIPAPKPKPEFQPKVISEIGVGMLYVIESQTELFIEQVPEGIVEIEDNQTDGESLRVNGVFADGPQKREWRTFKSNFVYILSSDKPGKTELVMVPSGIKSRDEIVRQPLLITGEGPRPPPDPGPEPNPDPVPPVPTTSFRVIFVKESGVTLNAEQMAIPGAKAIRDYLTAKTTPEGGLAGWREYDPQQNVANEQSTMKALWTAVRPKITSVPAMVIEVNGNATVMPFPANVSEALETLKKSGGQ